MKKFDFKPFAAGMAVMFLFMSTMTVFAGAVYKTITVSQGSVKAIIIDGVNKTPPADKQPFLYNNTNYVPLRYISESMYKNVRWDGATGSIYIEGVSVPEEDKTAISDAVELYIKHMNDESVQGLISDFSTSMNGFVRSLTIGTLSEDFDQLDLSNTLISKEVTAFKGNSCEVRLVTERKKASGEMAYLNQRITSVHGMIKENGKWKFNYLYLEKIQLI